MPIEPLSSLPGWYFRVAAASALKADCVAMGSSQRSWPKYRHALSPVMRPLWKPPRMRSVLPVPSCVSRSKPFAVKFPVGSLSPKIKPVERSFENARALSLNAAKPGKESRPFYTESPRRPGEVESSRKIRKQKKIAPLSSPIFPQVGGITLDDLRRSVE